MPYEQQLAALIEWLKTMAQRWEAFRGRFPTVPQRLILPISAAGLLAYAVLLRCLHLFNSEYYYMLSHDSYFFHWLAGRVMAGQGPPADFVDAPNYALHSGLAYPLAYVAKAAGWLFGLSSPDALDLVCKLVPPVVAVLSIVVVYSCAARIFDRRTGFFSALAWAALLHTILVGAAGYVDRDAVSILLVALGAMLFYMSKDWRPRVRGMNIGWLAAGAGVLVIEGLLYLYWSFVGPLLLLTIIGAYALLRFLLSYFDLLPTEPSPRRRVTLALGEANWLVVACIVIGNGIVVAVNADQVNSWVEFATAALRPAGDFDIAEMRGINMGDLLMLRLFIVPVLLALYFAWKRRSEGSIFFACWFLSMLILSLFANRVIYHAAPAACFLSGIGLAYLWSWMRRGELQILKKASVAALLVLIVLSSFSFYYAAASPRMTADRDWQDALSYLREGTPEESVILTWWDYGYWILDLGQRRPVVDNGFYAWDVERLEDIAVAYTTDSPERAVQIMEKYGATHLIFSSLDQGIRPVIMRWAGLAEIYSGFDAYPPESLVSRVLNGEFDSQDGLEVVYRSEPNSEVVVLHLLNSGPT